MSDSGSTVGSSEPPDRSPPVPGQWPQPAASPPVWRDPAAKPPAWQEPGGSPSWPTGPPETVPGSPAPPSPPLPPPPVAAPTHPPVGTPASSPPGGTSQPGSWSQAAGSYQAPPSYEAPTSYQTPGPQQTSAWPTSPGHQPGAAGYPAPKPAGPNLLTTAPALVVSAAITIGVIGLFVANLFVALGAGTGTPGRDRLLVFLSPADLAVGVALVVAVAMAVWHRQRAAMETDPAVGPAPALAANVGLMAGVVAAFLAAAALLRGIVDLTVPHQHGAIKIGHLFDALAAVLVAAAAALWGFRSRV